jgi:hypothetical protein
MIQLYRSYDAVSKYKDTRIGLNGEKFLLYYYYYYYYYYYFKFFSVFSTITVTRFQVVVELIQFALTHETLVNVFLNMFYVPTF